MAVLLRAKSQIFGLVTDLSTITTNITNEGIDRAAADLLLGGRITDELALVDGKVTTLDGLVLKKAGNLSELASVATSRTNLGVDSSAEVDAKIDAAKIALGTNYTVADIAARDAMTDLTVGDIVFVTDAGDTKWAQYKVATVNGAGEGQTWVTVMDEDVYLNAVSASAIKTSYESNADTNAFTDAAETKLGFITATAAIDLDKVIQSDELVTDATLAGVTDAQIASALAIKSYVDAQAASGGAAFKTESLTVTADKIVLLAKPKDGMILNFGTVRHVDVNGVAWDIPAVADGTDVTGKTYLLSGDAAGQFDTKIVTVQYPYTM